MLSISKDNICFLLCFTAKSSGHDNEYYFMGTAIEPNRWVKSVEEYVKEGI